MTIALVATLVLVTFLVLALLGTQLAYALLASGALGLIILDGTWRTAGVLATEPYSATASYFLVLIPLYVLIGMLFQNGGLAQDLYRVASRLLRRLPGGVGLATVAACAGFAAVTGSSVATVATIGKVSIDEMRKYGFSASSAAGIVAAGGTLGALIPPSIALVLYGILTGESVGALLIAGIVPGIIAAGSYAAYIMIKHRKRGAVPDRRDGGPSRRYPTEPLPHLRSLVATATSASGGSGTHGSMTSPGRPEPGAPAPVSGGAATATAARVPYEALLYIGVIFAILFGGLYSGWFTVIEAGAIGTVVALVIVIARAVARKQSIRALLKDSLSQSTSIMSMIFALLVGGSVLATFLVTTRLPTTISDWAAGLDLPPLLLLIMLLALLIPLGMVLDPLSIMLVTIPIYYPLITALGYDGVWFGILFLRMMEVAMITPPVGLNVFVVAGVSKDLTVEEVFRGAFPFVLLDLFTVGLFIAVPEIVTFLPALAGL